MSGSDDYSFLRTGLAGDTTISDEQDTENAQQVMSVLMMFLEDSVETAATYAVGSGRRRVTADDQIKALQYQARMFFQQQDLESRSIASLEEVREMWKGDENDEEDDEDDEYDDEDEDNGDSDSDENEGTDSAEGDEDDDNEESTTQVTGDEMIAAKAMVARVDAIAASWHLYHPEDPVLVRIKQGVDKTIARFRDA